MALGLQGVALTVTVSFIVGAILSWQLTATHKDAVWDARLSKEHAAHAEALAKSTQKVRALEAARRELATNLEVVHAEGKKELDNALATNRKLARELGGLRDPGRRPSCGEPSSGTSEPAGSPAGSSTGTELSAEATEFLLEFAREADDAAAYAGLCHRWVVELRDSQK